MRIENRTKKALRIRRTWEACASEEQRRWEPDLGSSPLQDEGPSTLSEVEKDLPFCKFFWVYSFHFECMIANTPCIAKFASSCEHLVVWKLPVEVFLNIIDPLGIPWLSNAFLQIAQYFINLTNNSISYIRVETRNQSVTTLTSKTVLLLDTSIWYIAPHRYFQALPRSEGGIPFLHRSRTVAYLERSN